MKANQLFFFSLFFFLLFHNFNQVDLKQRFFFSGFNIENFSDFRNTGFGRVSELAIVVFFIWGFVSKLSKSKGIKRNGKKRLNFELFWLSFISYFEYDRDVGSVQFSYTVISFAKGFIHLILVY